MPLSPLQPLFDQWRETAAWRRGQWGQLLVILIGGGLLGAGMVITVIVFVASDLAFRRTTAPGVRRVNLWNVAPA